MAPDPDRMSDDEIIDMWFWSLHPDADEFTLRQVSTAVSAVVSAFHSGAELVQLMRKRNRRSRSEQAYKEKALLDSLEAGETRVESQYAADCNEIGAGMRKGDAVARDRLLHIAVSMQSEIIRSLQISVRNETAIVDLTALHEASVMSRRDTLNILADLRQRLALDLPIEGPTRMPQSLRDSLETARRRQSGTLSDFTPSAVTIPDETENRSRLGRIFSNRRNSAQLSHRSSTHISPPTNTQAPLSPSLPWTSSLEYEEADTVAPLPQELPAEVPPRLRPPLDLHPPAYSNVTGAGNHGYPQEKPPSAYFPDSPRPVHPLEREAQMNSQSDSSTRNSGISTPETGRTDAELSAAIIGYLDNLRLDRETGCRDSIASRNTSLSTGSRYSESDGMAMMSSSTYSNAGSSVGPYLSMASPAARHSYSSVANSSPYSTTAPPNDLTAPKQNQPTQQIHFSSHRPTPSDSTYGSMPSEATSTSFQHHHRSRPSVSTQGSTQHSAPSILTSATPQTTRTSFSTTTPSMLGRPCKSNNYWGFCKGSWTLREDVKKALSLRQKPIGMYTSSLVWQCRECAFEGKSFGAKKPYIIDPNIHVSAAAGGIRYRWLFLAKSHVKQKHRALPSEDARFSYGCVFCSGEGRMTGVYGDVDTLLRHVFVEHAASGAGLSEDIKAKTRCVVGRLAGVDEEWDINIPVQPEAGLDQQQQQQQQQKQQMSRWSEDS
ncbi:hypothetical protein K490DRAFT_66422 [Saccharata proteae CBS 121410]|uniref:Uncharacterized protein n=1 Tax=Saccharata proteae CBS 121410 TaxID=1314787 RepID=A0A9P4LUL5_9PEZI|nr:hypothetical protein K490DRAFT_66422 [Saccharata proteae CBS 121410]